MGQCQCQPRVGRKEEKRSKPHRVTTELAEVMQPGAPIAESVRRQVETSHEHTLSHKKLVHHHLIERDPAEDYAFQKALGKGSFGSVWLGRPKPSGHDHQGAALAIKTIDLSHGDQVHTLACIAQEIKTMRRIEEHPNVVHVHDCYMHDGKFHMVLDYCAGGEMFARIASKSHYSEQDARFAFAQMVEAVGHCHAHGVVHRDLKPENVLYVAPEGAPDGDVLKVCDFGLSTVFHGHELRRIVGTPGYGAPEILNADKCHRYGKESDLWSLGCILYVMLSGLMPFWGATTQEVLESTCLGEYPLEGPEWEAISIDARDLIKRLIVVDPKERATCEDVFASPWIEHDHRAHDVHLAHFCANRRRYELKRTFKANVLAVIAVREFLAIAHRKRLHHVPEEAFSEEAAIPAHAHPLKHVQEDDNMPAQGPALKHMAGHSSRTMPAHAAQPACHPGARSSP
mmetsp:Transcript_12819/g.38167  ORF Transcript_12819/g.38167 Transcript_12819/m.38167 type:complete len:456 (-) Transcript_12819:76-1443(-)|eukprot:CAMPEP_0119269694 /NCGR_PEP_ID=MMETSP1329-20130426/6996_1 /TAXON_ID=114041 /ORGANISM="Genus nov. species nov., Strain RCC1024" /LENGTH=455 /DNA_ID=CAMNT_0007269695 /DNA_START=335 /DNA_END=1702 /DNA_ORIENTATION=-